MITVFIIDDHKIIIDAIVNHVEEMEDIEIIGSAISPLDGINKVLDCSPNVVLLDISMPEMNGLECAKRILNHNPDQKIIILSTHQEVSIIKKAMKMGVQGYISKAIGIETIEVAIRKVQSGDKFLGDEVSKAYMSDLLNPKKIDSGLSVLPKLTERETQILQLIANEATTQEISHQLFISTNTVETHRRNLIHKFQVRNSVGLIRKAIELRFLS